MPGTLRRSTSHLLVALGLLLGVACKPESTRPIVSAIDLRENSAERAVEGSAVLDGLATYDEYDPNVLSRDLERIERYYRARGYYEAKVTAARVLGVDPRHVRIEIRVVPGEPVRVHSVTLRGLANLPFSVVPEVTAARYAVKQGELFDEANFDEMKNAIGDALRDRGFPFAKIEAKAHIDLVKHEADVDVGLEAGLPATYGEVKIIGLHDVPEGPVRDNLLVVQGQPYSRRDLTEAQHAVVGLGVFSSVEIHEDLSHPETRQVPIEVRVRESKLRTVRLGGGAEFDVLRLNMHLRMAWEHLNFLGGTRYLSLSATPGVDLYPTRLDGKALLAPTRALLENSLQLKFKQPAFIEGRTTGQIDARYDIKPLLYPFPGGNSDPRSERIIGYQTVAASVGLERKWFLPLSRKWPGSITVTPSYNWQANFPFIYQRNPADQCATSSCLPDGLVDVRVAFPALVTTLDYRDDPIQTHRGFYLQNTLQVADKIFGGSVSDTKIQPEFRGYVPITKKNVTLATRLTMGFLIPRDYGKSLNPRSTEGQESTSNPTTADVVTDQEKLLLRAFYSGGLSSNRGYPLRGVGPHGPVGFLVPTGVNCSLVPVPASCIRPLGGFTLWEASLELRFPISGVISGVAFADASDVTREVGHVRFSVPHLSIGPGLRYLTPVGPLRLDIG